jgi:hypothetical protein
LDGNELPTSCSRVLSARDRARLVTDPRRTSRSCLARVSSVPSDRCLKLGPSSSPTLVVRIRAASSDPPPRKTRRPVPSRLSAAPAFPTYSFPTRPRSVTSLRTRFALVRPKSPERLQDLVLGSCGHESPVRVVPQHHHSKHEGSMTPYATNRIQGDEPRRFDLRAVQRRPPVAARSPGRCRMSLSCRPNGCVSAAAAHRRTAADGCKRC